METRAKGNCLGCVGVFIISTLPDTIRQQKCTIQQNAGKMQTNLLLLSSIFSIAFASNGFYVPLTRVSILRLNIKQNCQYSVQIPSIREKHIAHKRWDLVQQLSTMYDAEEVQPQADFANVCCLMLAPPPQCHRPGQRKSSLSLV
jgi:hypothetical protein